MKYMNGNSLVALLVACIIATVTVVYMQVPTSVPAYIGEIKHEIQKLLVVQQVQQRAEGILQGVEP